MNKKESKQKERHAPAVAAQLTVALRPSATLRPLGLRNERNRSFSSAPVRNNLFGTLKGFAYVHVRRDPLLPRFPIHLRFPARREVEEEGPIA